MNGLPVDVAQHIALISNSLDFYLKLGLVCKCFSQYLTNRPRYLRAMRWFTYITIDEDGSKEWKLINGKSHRDNDKPAIIRADGSKKWKKNGRFHRDNDLPAYIGRGEAGTKAWWINGERHRDNDKPAIIRADGSKKWYKNGQLHRDNDLPAFICINGLTSWWINGLKHRDNDNPAFIGVDGTKYWYQNGKRIYWYKRICFFISI